MIYACSHHHHDDNDQCRECLCLPELFGGTMEPRLLRETNILLLRIMRAGELIKIKIKINILLLGITRAGELY